MTSFPQDWADEVWQRHARGVEDQDRAAAPRWLELKAHHEAGHIVAGWALDGTLAGATTLPSIGKDGRRNGGKALVFLGSDGGAASPAEVVVSMAGPIAAHRFDSAMDDGGIFDREDIDRLLSRMCRSPAAAEIVHRHCEADAYRLVRENWDAIEAVAAALLERECLDAGDLSDILGDVLTVRSNATKRERAAAWARAQEHAAAFALIAREMPR